VGVWGGGGGGGGGIGGRCLGLPTLPLSSADCLEIQEPQPSGTLRACPGRTGTALPLLNYPHNSHIRRGMTEIRVL